MPAVKCKAKNPATCKYHGSPSPTTKPVEAEDLFAQALSRNPRIAAMEAQILWANRKHEELKNRYDFFKPEVTATFEPVEYGNPILDFYNKEYLALESKATAEELESLRDYTGIGYTPVNEHLMSPDKYAARFKTPENYQKQLEKVKEKIALLDSVISKAGETAEPRTLYRVLGQDQTVHFTSAEEYAVNCGFVEGKEVEFKNFSSTTLDPAFVNRYIGDKEEHTSVALVITARKGAPVALTATSEEENQYTQDTEREILLPRDTRYKVTKVTRAEFNHHSEWYEPITPVTVYLEEI